MWWYNIKRFNTTSLQECPHQQVVPHFCYASHGYVWKKHLFQELFDPLSFGVGKGCLCLRQFVFGRSLLVDSFLTFPDSKWWCCIINSFIWWSHRYHSSSNKQISKQTRLQSKTHFTVFYFVVVVVVVVVHCWLFSASTGPFLYPLMCFFRSRTSITWSPATKESRAWVMEASSSRTTMVATVFKNEGFGSTKSWRLWHIECQVSFSNLA